MGFFVYGFLLVMNLESITPFLLIVAPFAIAFFIEALVIYFFRIKTFWISIGLSFLVNLLSLVVLFAGSVLLTNLGYEFNGLRLPVQVLLVMWWLSVVSDGILLQLFSKAEKRKLYFASITMNSLSYLFLWFFITNSH